MKQRGGQTRPSSRVPYAAPVAGGLYAADQNEDGTWNIRAVPIFAAHERHEQAFDGEWLTRAVARSASRYEGGYLPPLHVGHHPSLRVERAGWFLPLRVEDMTLPGNDNSAPVVVADLLSVPGPVYSRIQAGELPYCSVEVMREHFDDPEIKSLALLEHEAPYFPFPLITIGQEQPAQRADALVASYSSGGGVSALFRFGGPAVKKPAAKPAKKSAPARVAYMADEMDAHKKAAGDALAAFTETLAKLSEAAQKAAADLGLMGSDGGEESSEGEDVQAAEDTGPAEAPAEGEGEEDKDEKMAASAGARPALTVHTGGSAPVNYAAEAAFAGRLAALERKIAAQDRARAGDQIVGQALEELANYGAGEDMRRELLAYHAKGGAPAVSAYVAAIKAHGVQVPPESWTGDLGPVSEQDPPEVAAYAARGAQAHREARATWQSWKRTGSQRPLAEYIAANVDAENYIAGAARRR